MEISIRVEEILNQWDKDWKDLINHDLEEYNFIDVGINNQKYFSYIPYDKLQYFDKLDYSSEDRLKYAVEIKPTKLLNKLLKETITTEQSEKLLGIIGKYDDYILRFVEGKDIIKYYTSKFIEKGNTMLEDSCMNNKPEEYFDLYVDKARLIILENPKTSKIAGRALLWKASLNGTEIDFMDRVYSNPTSSVKFTKYAVDNDFYMRHSDNKYTFYHRDKKYLTQDVDLRLNVDIRNYKYIPYMDTFCLHRKDYMATVDFYNWMQNTSGGFVYCSKCGKQVDEYAGYYYSRYDFEKKNSIIYCEDCVEEHQILIKGKKYKVTNKHIRYCEHCKSWHLEIDMKSYLMCKECWDKFYVKINGRKYSKKGVKVYYDEESKEWKLKERKQS